MPPFLVGIPAAYYFGQEGLHNVLCIDLLGHSLEDQFDACNRRFSVKTVAMAAKQMVPAISFETQAGQLMASVDYTGTVGTRPQPDLPGHQTG